MRKLLYLLLFIPFASFSQNYWESGLEKYTNGDTYGAIADYTKMIEMNPNDTIAVLVYSTRGVAKAKLNDYNGAISDYNKAIEIEPNLKFTSIAYYYRGVAKAMLEDYYEAIADFTKFIEIEPMEGEPYYNRGYSKYVLGDKNGACQDARKAQDLGYDASELIKIVCN